MNEQEFIKIFALNFFIATEFQNLSFIVNYKSLLFNDEETLDSATLFISKSYLFCTHHLLLEQEQGLSTQLSSLSVSSVILSPQW